MVTLAIFLFPPRPTPQNACCEIQTVSESSKKVHPTPATGGVSTFLQVHAAHFPCLHVHALKNLSTPDCIFFKALCVEIIGA